MPKLHLLRERESVRETEGWRCFALNGTLTGEPAMRKASRCFSSGHSHCVLQCYCHIAVCVIVGLVSEL